MVEIKLNHTSLKYKKIKKKPLQFICDAMQVCSNISLKKETN